MKSLLLSGFAVLLSLLPLRAADGPAKVPDRPVDISKDRTLYTVGYAHLDTQWRWTYPQVIREFLAETLHDNFRLIDTYPDYVFNFSGSRRYMMMKEYYPAEYAKLKQYVAAGRWFPCGSSVDEGDANVPSLESFVRHMLYGNRYFRSEFGVASDEFMLPDCFGFPADLPTMLAHCGIKGFSTQKLTWGSSAGIPFKVGVWNGPDGSSVIAALDPGSYGGGIDGDLSQDAGWLKRIEDTGALSGAFVDYHYYGTGDRGGAPKEDSVRNLEKSLAGTGPVRIVSARADEMFNAITPAQRAKLPTYTGELLLTEHSAGSLSSQATMKRWNRKSELLADDAERASVAAAWLGSAPYPSQRLYNAWQLVLGSQMHDMLPGTSLPKAYEYCWNDFLLAQNQFVEVARDAVGGVAAALDTRSPGVPLVVYNPLSFDRTDVVEASVALPGDPGRDVAVFGPDGKEVPSQIVGTDDGKTRFLFAATVPSIGFAVYDVRPSSPAAVASTLSVSTTGLENEFYKVTLNKAGDVASIYDKKAKREVLSAPLRLSFHEEKPRQYPAWNMDWKDRQKPASGFVDGRPKVRIVENGPVRVALEVDRTARGSRFVQTIALAAGPAGDRVSFANRIDWQTQGVSLKADFPFAAANPKATFDSQLATVERGNDDAKKFEMPLHQWMDLTGTDGREGAAVLNDSKYGSDKPDDATLRLTLLYTPAIGVDAYQDQGSQDLGRHEVAFAVAPHGGDWRAGNIPARAARLNQPLLAFRTPAHEGALGKSFSLFSLSDGSSWYGGVLAPLPPPPVAIEAVKKAEDGDEIVVRIVEQLGRGASGLRLQAGASIVAAREIDGQERSLPGTVEVKQGGQVVFDMKPYQIRAFALKLAPPAAKLAAPESQSLPLAFDVDAVSTDKNRADGDFDGQGRTIPAEQLPATISFDGVDLPLGPTDDLQKNALACHGQKLAIPEGYDHLHLLAAAREGDRTATFLVGGKPQTRTVEEWTGYVGQWDNRLWEGKVPELAYTWTNALAGLAPGYVKPGVVAWFCSHRHHPVNGNEFYQYSYLFDTTLALDDAKEVVLPDDPAIRVFAAVVSRNGHEETLPVQPLSDRLDDRSRSEADAPTIVPGGGSFSDSITASIAAPLYWRAGGLRYTIDGTEPTAASPLYAGPFPVNRLMTVKAREFDENGKGGTVAAVTLDVADTTPPSVVAAQGASVSREIVVTFSEPVRKEDAEDASHYRLDPPQAVQAAALDASGTSVVLRLAQPPAAGKVPLTVSGLRDRSSAANRLESQTVDVLVSQPVYALASFSADGANGLDAPVDGLPVAAGHPWTISFSVRPAAEMENHTALLGFGVAEDKKPGLGRYLCKFANGIHFWSRDHDVETRVPFTVGAWQAVAATYDGSVVIVYKDGVEIGRREESFSDDEAVVRIAPSDPWDKHIRFKGAFRDIAIWPDALTPETVRALAHPAKTK